MARFHGNIGFSTTSEVEPGIWEEAITEHEYYGDITRNISNNHTESSINNNISLNNSISIVADPYATNNFQYMRYVILNGIKWSITNAEVEYPRIILSIGGMYNEQQNQSSN
jgi:hypothetical protein